MCFYLCYSFTMTIARKIYAETTVSMTDLRRDPKTVMEIVNDLPIAVLNHNKPAAYLLSAKAYEALLEKVDDIELIEVVKQRRGGKTVKVVLEDL